MSHRVKKIYVVHHSHTDIGYTDLQERIIHEQISYIRSVLDAMKKPENSEFRWNCETWFCVEKFLEIASEQEKEQLFALIRQGRVGLSANYLNFTDLADYTVLSHRMDEMSQTLGVYGIRPVTAMNADINGISMGHRDALIEHGVEFLYTNIHTHHGMFPLYQNQTAYWWENSEGKRLLVWNGEHYNLGNGLGIRPNRQFGQGRWTDSELSEPVDCLYINLDSYLTRCEDTGYRYDFIILSVSGVLSDNAPPEPEILRVIQMFNQRYGGTIDLQMVSLQELYEQIRDRLQDVPVVQGDLTDWWASGVGSTPGAVKHFKEAQRVYDLCCRLEPNVRTKYPDLLKTAEDHLLLYAEHTWGHSSSISNPCDTMVLNLEMRKSSYASKAHESVSSMLGRIAEEKGDILRYYNSSGQIKVLCANQALGLQKVEFYIESCPENIRITREDQTEIPCQVSPHPRGRLITFFDRFDSCKERLYTFQEIPANHEVVNSRLAYAGAERVRDLVNDVDPVSYRLPYSFENRWFRISYRPQQGIIEFINRLTGENMLSNGAAPFFTPIYECTSLRPDLSNREYEERRLIGRNIRGQHADRYTGILEEIVCRERGEVFTVLEFQYRLPGTIRCSVVLRLYEEAPCIDFQLKLGKTLSTDIESTFLPLTLFIDGKQSLYLKKGREAFRPGVDQIPGTCMEYYISDHGAAFVGKRSSALISSYDAPLFYMGEMCHHFIRLCDQQEINNQRPLYSWVMNNLWETNFKLDLSGFYEFRYTLWLSNETNPENVMSELSERSVSPTTLIVG